MSDVKVFNETRPITDLHPDPDNARQHDESQIGKIAESIRRFGYVSPVIIRPNGQIIGGHATWTAMKGLGETEIECRVVVGLTEAQYTALAIALNKLPETSSWNEAVLADTLRDLVGDGEDVLRLGFTDNDVTQFLGLDGDGSLIEVKEIETSAVKDEFWISVRGKLKDQARALQGLRQVMAEIEGVTVELGTIPLE